MANVNQVDVGAFVGDDWRVKPNLTLSLGLRFETQTNIHDWHDWAPRIGFAWAPGQSKNNPRPKTVFRGGFGIFYDRVSEQNILTAERFNGILQQQYVVTQSAANPIPFDPTTSRAFPPGLSVDYRNPRTPSNCSIRICTRPTSCRKPSRWSASCRRTPPYRSLT